MSPKYPKIHLGILKILALQYKVHIEQPVMTLSLACRALHNHPSRGGNSEVPHQPAQSHFPSAPATSYFPDHSRAVNLCEQFFLPKKFLHIFLTPFTPSI